MILFYVKQLVIPSMNDENLSKLCSHRDIKVIVWWLFEQSSTEQCCQFTTLGKHNYSFERELSTIIVL